MHRKAGAALCPKQQCIGPPSGGSRERCLQTPAETLHRDGIRSPQQGTSRRRGHPHLCRKSAPTAPGAAAGTKTGDGHRPGIPHRMQGGLPGRTGQPAAQREHLSASAGEQTQGSGRQNRANDRNLPDRRHSHRQRNGRPRDRRHSRNTTSPCVARYPSDGD